MKRTLTIDVTAADIKQGDIDSVTNCAIGLAMQRAIGHAEVSQRVESLAIENRLAPVPKHSRGRHDELGTIASGC